MKTSEIEIALKANPETTFWITKRRNRHLKNNQYIRILEVHEKIVPKTYSSPEKRMVTFECETLKIKTTELVHFEKMIDGQIVMDENGKPQMDYRWDKFEPIVIIEKLSGIMPQDISYIVSGQKTLEDLRKESQDYETKKYHEAIKTKEYNQVLLAEIKSKTELSEWDLKTTPIKVLQVLREALNK